MRPLVFIQGDPKNCKKTLSLILDPTLGNYNLISKDDTLNLSADSLNVARNKSEYQLLALCLVRRRKYGILKSKIIPNVTFRDSRTRKMTKSTKFQSAI